MSQTVQTESGTSQFICSRRARELLPPGDPHEERSTGPYPLQAERVKASKNPETSCHSLLQVNTRARAQAAQTRRGEKTC